jgi:glucose/arabinose dehydrogenase
MIPTVNVAPATGWPTGTTPVAAAGLEVAAFASGLEHPRWLYVLPNGDVLVAESNRPPAPEGSAGGGLKKWVMKRMMARAGAGVASANRITLLRDADGDGVAETRSVFLQDLNSPFGMALIGNAFYVANADAIVRFPYTAGATTMDSGAGVKVVDLPAGINHHWTKNLLASRDGTRLYATVGSNSNIAEKGMAAEEGRAAIWEIDPKAGTKRLFAAGLRNPNGLAWEPRTGALWTVVNERDELGSDLVPDYLTSVVDGGFYGWPYSYWGQNVDERVQPQQPDLVAKAIKPDYALGAHVAPLGLTTSEGAASLPSTYSSGMFVGQHGSWNRRPLSGYSVVFVPFRDGKPSDMPAEILTGFVNSDGEAHGRPVGVAIDKRGALLVADDVGNTIWRVASAAQSGQRSERPGERTSSDARGRPAKLLLAALSVALADAVAADEEIRPQDRPAAFRELDVDGDGWISVEEAAAHPEVAANFAKADADGDGKLSLEEFEAVALNRSDQPGKFRNPDQG